MALIHCPKCGKEISDKAARCVHCGYELTANNKRKCSECGAEFTDNATECPVCGCPVEIPEQTPQQVEVTGVKLSHRNKRIIVAVAIIGLLLAAALLGVARVKKQNNARDYGNRLETAVQTMLIGAGEAETSGNLVKLVWNNAIHEERDSQTDPYTRPKGYFVSDFNEALQNLFADKDFSDQIASIKSNQDTVQTLMKNMKNPPDEYEDAYDALSELYDAYTNFTNLVVNPSGSLQTFSANFNDADTETLNCYNAMSLYLE